MNSKPQRIPLDELLLQIRILGMRLLSELRMSENRTKFVIPKEVKIQRLKDKIDIAELNDSYLKTNSSRAKVACLKLELEQLLRS